VSQDHRDYGWQLEDLTFFISGCFFFLFLSLPLHHIVTSWRLPTRPHGGKTGEACSQPDRQARPDREPHCPRRFAPTSRARARGRVCWRCSPGLMADLFSARPPPAHDYDIVEPRRDICSLALSILFPNSGPIAVPKIMRTARPARQPLSSSSSYPERSRGAKVRRVAWGF
jgi:hypothetical protein